MVKGRGIRNWEEGLYLFRSEDREAAFRRALEIGEGGQSGGKEEGCGRFPNFLRATPNARCGCYEGVSAMSQ